MDRHIQCEILKMTHEGKIWMTKEIFVNFSNDQVTISKDDRLDGSEVSYKYYKLTYEEANENQIVADGLKILFNPRDARAMNCLEQLKRLIDERKPKKSDKRRHSGPRNTLTNSDPVKSYKSTTLEFTIKPHPFHSPMSKVPELFPNERAFSNPSPPTQLHRVTPPRPTQTNFQLHPLTQLPMSKKKRQNTPIEPSVILPIATIQSSPLPTTVLYSDDFLVDEPGIAGLVSSDLTTRTPRKSAAPGSYWNIWRKRENSPLLGDVDVEHPRKKQSVLKLPPILGIPNLGNTCFMGAVTQALCSLEGFVSDFSSPFWHSLYPPLMAKSYSLRSTGSELLGSSVSLFAQLIQSITSPERVKPSILDLKDCITRSTNKYRGYSQHDAHEFLTDLISVLETEQLALLKQKLLGTSYEEELESPQPKETSEATEHPIQSDSVVGLPSLHVSVIPTVRRLLSVIDVTLRCTNCYELRHKKEHYHDYSLLLPANPIETSQTLSLESLLASFFSPDKRDLACEKCSVENGQVEVTTQIEKFPDVLILHLKRFEYNFRINDYSKILTPVSFPSGLDMSKYGSEKSRPPDIDNTVITKPFSSAFPLVPSSVPLSPALPSPGEGYDLDRDFESTNNNNSNMETGFSTPPKKPQQHNVLRDLEEPADDAAWSCSHCTFLNPETFLACQICNAVREEPKDEKSDDEVVVIEAKDVRPVAPEVPSGETAIPSNQLHNPFFYSLVAVVRHVGKSAFSGHYTCDVIHQRSNQDAQAGEGARALERHWYRCDDSRVTEISQETVLSQKADPYILFYKRNSPSPQSETDWH